jgi:hypothetical protein
MIKDLYDTCSFAIAGGKKQTVMAGNDSYSFSAATGKHQAHLRTQIR